ncbi:aspartate/glutamate racemase family protein [Thalassospira sp.]|uniref:glutamate racemase n=1 Tax=Thalassospira sp. TaxID=1912094 RepID=UPI000C395B28|nr:aspartate/glutamate racemase family protein [Thalassospira sp.]MBC07637.1 Asp/Glu racemase [Thalassospira sp.]|tara:strand:+ start:475 stop:1266 length:792 start_codon:yes stop_codon:yes gene_type:complete
MTPDLIAPVAVFDAGIGSYSIVAKIREKWPQKDIVYFADRASFPYGRKNATELAEIMARTVTFLDGFAPSNIVIASNAPSIMVLDEVVKLTDTPVSGVLPPVKQAITASNTGHVAVMGVASLIESPMFADFIAPFASSATVRGFNASGAIDHVENGDFLFEADKTAATVQGLVDEIRATDPAIDVMTLSSTHLPWLRTYFEKAAPDCLFLDPADAVVEALDIGPMGNGITHAVATEAPGFEIAEFEKMLAQIGVQLTISKVSL